MGEGDVTRRSLLARAVAGGGALALGRAAPAAGRMPETAGFALPVPAGRARSAVARALVPARAAAVLPAQFAGQPRIIPRSAWVDRGCRPRRAASYGRVEVGFVHHTVSANNYRPRDSAAMVRGICHFHKYV